MILFLRPTELGLFNYSPEASSRGRYRSPVPLLWQAGSAARGADADDVIYLGRGVTHLQLKPLGRMLPPLSSDTGVSAAAAANAACVTVTGASGFTAQKTHLSEKLACWELKEKQKGVVKTKALRWEA